MAGLRAASWEAWPPLTPPPLVRWSPEREARGRGPAAALRCEGERGCPFGRGACPEHDDAAAAGERERERRRNGLSPPVPRKRCPHPEHAGPNPLPLAAFYANRARRDGLDVWCKSCKNREARARTAARRPPPALPSGFRRCPAPRHDGERVLPVTAFYPNRAHAGRDSWCKPCMLAARREARAARAAAAPVYARAGLASAAGAAPSPAAAASQPCACGCGQWLDPGTRPGRKFATRACGKRQQRRDERAELTRMRAAARAGVGARAGLAAAVGAAVPPAVPEPEPVPLASEAVVMSMARCLASVS